MDRSPCNFFSRDLFTLNSMPSPEIYTTLEGQIIVCHVDYQTVAEQGAGAMFHVAHILKENVN